VATDDESAGAGSEFAAAPLTTPLAAPVTALPVSAAGARAAVLGVLESRFCGRGNARLDDVVVADALLVTSELVTNAIRHGGGLTVFSAEVDADTLRVCVGDASPEHPVGPISAVSPDDTIRIGGYGWPLVHSLAHRVTVVPHREGKIISALLPLM
jgi:hypothetical protein